MIQFDEDILSNGLKTSDFTSGVSSFIYFFVMEFDLSQQLADVGSSCFRVFHLKGVAISKFQLEVPNKDSNTVNYPSGIFQRDG